MDMASAYNIPSSTLEDIPIVNCSYCVKISPSKSCVHSISKSEKKMIMRNRWNIFENYKIAVLAGIVFVCLIMCFSASMIYMTLVSDSFVVKPVSHENSTSNADEIPYETILRDLRRNLYSILPDHARNRFTRDTRNHCKENIEHCKSVLESMKRIVSVVNDSMPYFHALANNLANNSDGPKSEFVEMLECLECKQLEKENTADRFSNDLYTVDDHSDNGQMQNNIHTVINLLNNSEPDAGKRNSSFEYANPGQLDSGKDNSSVIDDRGSLDKTTKSQSVEAAIDASMTVLNAESNKTNKTVVTSGNSEQGMSTVSLTTKPEGQNVMEIANDNADHSLVHPSIEGHAEDGTPEKETENDSKDSRKAGYQNYEGRIVANTYFQPKGNMDTSPMMIPTAETIKSSQQLQLTPTMSWMPYPVCFFGSPPNGPFKQSAPGQMSYPPSGAGYPVSMPQQRAPIFPNQAAAPNYVQVQAQSVQFMPMQQYPGNSAGQRVGPTGPGMQNFPIFPGHQSPSGSARPPYYCTYIPTPTFQLPPIPGVSEFQRSSDVPENDKKEGQTDAWNVKKQLQTGPGNLCPFNTIRCGDGSDCISRSQWCNGHVDCGDASDEIMCSCRDRISKERLCDGYFDCPHGEDELGCLGCSKTSFSCNDWTKRYTANNCVPLSQRCDGITQCSNGKDEMDCNILTPTYIEGKNVFTIGYVEGYLHRNLKGQWYPVCSGIKSWAKDACTSEIGPDMNGDPEIQVHTLPNNTYKGPYLSEVEKEIKVIPSCLNTAVYVRCPRIPCGTRVLSHQDSLRPYNMLEDAELIRENAKLKTEENNNMAGKMNYSPNENSVSDFKGKGDDIVGSQLRVVGGRASQPRAWPFLVAIYKDGNFHCGGVILNQLWILTAAHCLEGYADHYYEVQAGMLRRFSFSPMAQSRKAKYTIMHPHYGKKDMTNDIGLIMMDEPLHFNRWVRQVCLPKEDVIGSMWRQRPEANSTCIAIGWGATRERGPDPDHLREVEVPILPKCKYTADQTDAAICAGYPEGGRDACQGDSGGPLMCRNPNSESQWYVAGVVSHGEGCARPNEPGTYSRVSYFMNWIEEVTTGGMLPPFKRVPLERCPGFSCERGLGRCLPIEKHCNRMVDCLDGEDEINCPSQIDYTLFRKSDSDTEFISSTVDRDSGDVSANLSMDDGTTPETESSSQILQEEEESSTVDSRDVNSATPMLPSSVIFTCSKLIQSISFSKRCDRVFDCEDGTDEVNCTCRDFLFTVQPSAICDGFLDCDDKSDEENCSICKDDEFLCRRSNVCIPLSKKCNGKIDCPLKDDEMDCFALTDGKRVQMEADERPSLNMDGVLSRYSEGKWQPICHRPIRYLNQSTAALIGQNMCEYFGFTSLQSVEEIIVRDSELEILPWKKEEATPDEHSSEYVAANEGDITCPGLRLHCRPVLNTSVNAHLVVDPRTGSRTYLWPWLAAIFVDGSYRCSAILLDLEWLLSSSGCIEDVRLQENYTIAVLGYNPSYQYADAPYQQLSIIDEVKLIPNSDSVLLHLKNAMNVTRHVQPLFLEKKIYPPGPNDICVAVGTDKYFETKSIFVKPVLQNCQSCNRCFVNTSIPECLENATSDWSGTVFCRGQKGWYPAATFHETNGSCSFRNVQTLTSMDYINPYLTQALEEKLTPAIEPTCDGFRCSIGQCIPQTQVCDGVPNCRDSADEDPKNCKQFRENCINSVDGCRCNRSELRCGNGQCVEKSAFCDGTIDCSDGTDEPVGCTCADYLKLTAPERLCDGVRHCVDKTDESPEFCSCKDTSFKCTTPSGNETCIPQDFICDGDRDCVDGEDEAQCRMIRQTANDGPGTGEVIRRSYGVWHTECFPTPITSDEEAGNLCAELGYASGNISNDTRILDEPLLPERDRFYMVKLNYWQWMMLRDDKPLITLDKSNETCHRAFVSCS